MEMTTILNQVTMAMLQHAAMQRLAGAAVPATTE